MLFVLSPAKSLDYDTPTDIEPTKPLFIPQATELISILKTKRSEEIAALMDLSTSLADLNVDRYAKWSTRSTAKNSKPAVLAFDGDVYDGLQAKTLGADDLQWAQQHIAILSGLYGVLRPLDKLQPYRLEMGTALATPRGRNLYDFWGTTIANYLNRRLKADASPVLVNLASQEYFRSVDLRTLKARVVECVFEDWKDGDYKIISFFAKKARGAMARYAILNRIATPQGLQGFDLDGYGFAPEVSVPDRLVFRRRTAG